MVDCDIHISARGGEGELTVEGLMRLMDENGVDKAITWPMVSYTRQVAEDNRAIAQGMKKYPGRIIGFGGLNPRLGIEPARDELKRCIEEYGMKGFKLNGARDGYYIDDPELALPLIEKASQFKKVIALHCGVNDPARTHPWRIGNIAKSFLETKILMIHMGGAGSPGLYDAAIKIAQQCPNIYLVATEADAKAIVRAINTLGVDRICYGSDEPFSLMKVALATFKVLLEDLSKSEQDLIMGQNIMRVLS